MNQQIVNLRALAILFIVLGHSIIIYDTTFDLFSSNVEMPIFETLKHWISFVQLKLFFSISGFLLCYKVMKMRSKTRVEVANTIIPFSQNKILRLLVPYICVALLWMDPIKIMLGVPDYTLSSDLLVQQLQFSNCGHLWYLPCLFIIFLMFYPVLVLIRNCKVMHVFMLILFAGANYLCGRMPEAFQLQNATYYLFYFYLGYFINYTLVCITDDKIAPPSWLFADSKRSKTVVVSLLFAFTLLAGQIVERFTSIGYELYLSVVVLLMFYYYMPSFSNKFVNEISNRSYGIYLFHSPLIYTTAFLCPDINPWLMLFLNFVVFGSIAYAMTVILSRTKLKFIVGL